MRPEVTKRCPMCEKDVPYTDEYWPEWTRAYCLVCRRLRARWYKRLAGMGDLAGLTLNGLIRWCIQNNHGKCDMCGTEFKSPKDENFDHCHRTGKPRGLLCFRCNTLLGKIHDDLDLLKAGVAYLEVHGLDDLVKKT